MPISEDLLDRLRNPIGRGPITQSPVPYAWTCENVYRWEDVGDLTCGSPCNYRFDGKPLCYIHLLRAVNTKLVELGVIA